MNDKNIEHTLAEALSCLHDVEIALAKLIRERDELIDERDALAKEVAALRQQPAPVVDDARMARALEWLRNVVALGFPVTSPEHLPAIEEAIAAYNPNCGARTARAQGVQS